MAHSVSIISSLALVAVCASDVFGVMSTERGRPDVEIVLPVKASQEETFAANELKYHLDAALGGAAKVVSESASSAEGSGVSRFFVGNTDAAKRQGIAFASFQPEERLVKGIGGDVYLLGGPDPVGRRERYALCFGGTLYAVYDYLEKTLGVKWLWPGKSGEVIPPRTRLPCLDGVERRGIEPFECRYMKGDPARPAEDTGDYDAYIGNRRLWLTRNRCGFRRTYNYGHAFTAWWDRFRKTDRDLFALLPNGTRSGLKGVKEKDYGNCRTLCVSNPKVAAQCVKDWLKGGEKRWHQFCGETNSCCLNLCENDGPGSCVCANCRAWDAKGEDFERHPYWKTGSKLEIGPYGRGAWLASSGWGGNDGKLAGVEPPSVADRYVRFYTSVLDEARKYRPNAIAAGYAYSNYRKPPLETRVPDGCVIIYVPRSFFPYDASQQREFRAEWMGWRKAGATKMGYRPNYMLAGADMPFNDARLYADDISFVATNGAVNVTQDSLTGHWSAQAVRNYAMLRVLRSPEMTYDEMEDEFVSAFGAAADDIRAYCRLLEEPGRGMGLKAWSDLCSRRQSLKGRNGGSHVSFSAIVADVWTADWFARAEKILEDAREKVSGAEAGRVDFLAKGLKEAHLKRDAVAAFNSGDKAAEENAVRALFAYRASIRNEGVYNRFRAIKEERGCFHWTEPPTGPVASATTVRAAHPWTHLDYLDDPDEFRFAIVPDRAGGDFRGAFTNALAKVNLLRPAFVMTVGDLVPGAWVPYADSRRQYEELREMVKSVEPPFFFTPGNHDLIAPPRVPKPPVNGIDPSAHAESYSLWKEFHGATYYKFVYRNTLFIVLNSNELPGGDGERAFISDRQYAWLRETLAAHADVRWTFIFMHHPAVWPTAKWEALEAEVLAKRRYSVFSGDWHQYLHAKRLGHDYYVLSVAGGCSTVHDHRYDQRAELAGPAYGEMDHIAWVTVTKNGPKVVNLMLDGILPGDYLNELTTKSRAAQLALDRPVSPELKARIAADKVWWEEWEKGDDVWVRKFGYNLTNCTDCIQKALDSGAKKLVIDAQRGPWITGPVTVRSNTEVIVEDDVEIVRKPGAFRPGQPVFDTSSATNVVIRWRRQAERIR